MHRNITVLGWNMTVSSECTGTRRNVSPYRASRLPGPLQQHPSAGLSVWHRLDLVSRVGHQPPYVGTETLPAERAGVVGAIQGALWLLNHSK